MAKIINTESLHISESLDAVLSVELVVSWCKIVTQKDTLDIIKCVFILLGGVLLSQDPAVQVPSALEGLTVVFGMGTCGTPPPSPPNA